MIDNSEAKARIKINKLLENSGWDFDRDIILEDRISMKRYKSNDLGEEFEKTQNGFIDYLLLDEKGKYLLVLEAKASNKNPLCGKEQAKDYAKSINVRFVILSNGNEHYFWDLENGNPISIDRLYTQKEILTLINRDENEKFSLEELEKFTINSNMIIDKTLRYYQIEAIEKIRSEILLGRKKFLFVMATGTGKTLTSAAIIKMLIKTGIAKRVLFLVDRIELEEQAEEDFKKYFSVSGKQENFFFQIYKKDKNRWDRNEILITTIQSLYENYTSFSKTEFDLIISDEAHRSIGGFKARKVFDYFNCYKLGLTATPKGMMKNVDLTTEKDDFRQLELRKMKDTYLTFGCENFKPTYSYTLEDGVKDDFLILPKVIELETEITTKLLSEKGYGVTIEHEDGFKEEKNYKMKDFERKFKSEETNRVFCEGFMNLALKDPISGEIGKSLIYCVSQSHAFEIVKILNEIASNKFPKKYNSDFAMAIVSDTQGDITSYRKSFRDSKNNLNGYSEFNEKLEEYETSKTRVCVTYGMMTTGYDCSDLLNIAMMRPIYSPSEFIQIKGRGTRKFDFKYENIKVSKKEFYLFDYFKNCEYFEEFYDYKKPIKLNISGGSKPKPTPPIDLDRYICKDYDEIRNIFEKRYGLMRIDEEFYKTFDDSKKIYTFDDFYEILKEDSKFLEDAERSFYEKYHRNGKIEELYDWIIRGIEPKTKLELLENLFSEFLVKIENKEDVNTKILRKFFIGYFTKKKVREIIENEDYNKINDLNMGIDENQFLEIRVCLNNIKDFYIENKEIIN